MSVEGNVVSCIFKDMLLLDDVTLDKHDFITEDGRFYFSLLMHLRQKGFYSLDEVTIMSNVNDEIMERYEACGGWKTIQHQMEIINEQNFDTYLDILYRENIMLHMCNDGIDLTHSIDINGKKKSLIKMFRKMSADAVSEWWEARISSYGSGYSSKVIEESEIDFDDDFIESCQEGFENGVPFDSAGLDVNKEIINCFPFLSKQINGLREGTLTMLGGFSSAGKSTWWITVIMALLNHDRKVLIISNEERMNQFKIKFLVWMLGKYLNYFKLTKKKLMSGDISFDDKIALKKVQDYWKDNYKGRVKFVSINDADMGIVKKKIRENVLRYGYDTVLYDTFKIQADSMQSNRQDLSLVRDSRELDKLAKKYNIIMLASVQLAEYMRGKLFLDSSVLSNSKQIKEQLENLFLMRTLYEEELDPKSKYYCHPFRLKKVDDKWVEEEYTPDANAVWRVLFVEKTRTGSNSSDIRTAYMLKYSGDYAIFRETCQCRPKHGEIR